MQKLLFYENDRYRRCAVVKDNVLEFFREEFKDELPTYGNVYIGKIVKIVQSVNAVFIDYGQEKLGFLNLHSIHPEYFHNVNKTAILEKIAQKNLLKAYKNIDINKVLRVGDLLIVQVTRDAKKIDQQKGSMLSTFITIKGKYFKYIPNSCHSQNFLPEELKHKVKNGSIFFNKKESNINLLKEDIDILIDTWDQIITNFNKQESNILYQNQSFIYGPLSFNIDKTIIENKSKKFFKKYIKLLPNVTYENSIFKELDGQIEELFQPIVQLPSGGYIIITNTPACTTIDVNLGNVINKPIEEAVLQVNTEAALEIAKSIFLRNISGVIIVDFIDMNNTSKKTVEQVFKKAIEQDLYKVAHTNITQFGIMEICRQYQNTNILHNKYEKCQVCDRGYVNPIKFQAEQLLREIEYLENSHESSKEKYIEVFISNLLSQYLLNNALYPITQLKQNYQFFVQDFHNGVHFKIIEM